MFSQTWRRPSKVTYPEVWRRFEKTTKDGKTLKFKIQTATEEYYDDILDAFNKYYLPGEALNSTAGCHESPECVELMNELTRMIVFPQETVLVCVLEDDAGDSTKKLKLVGFNMLAVTCANEEMDHSKVMELESGAKLLYLWSELKKHLPDVHETHGVKDYLGSFGLCVVPEFRGLSLSKDILLCRIAMCKEIGLKVTSSMFTVVASQVSAMNIGFIEDGSYSYKDLEDIVGIKINSNSPYCRQLSYVVPN